MANKLGSQFKTYWTKQGHFFIDPQEAFERMTNILDTSYDSFVDFDGLFGMYDFDLNSVHKMKVFGTMKTAREIQTCAREENLRVK